jgi:photosystem II stability/assembly factor-like uncharacterized protein
MRTLKISLLVFILSTAISAQWFVKPVSFDNLLNTVILINPDTGFLAAGYPPGVLKTVDGGNSWIMDSLGSSNLEDMFFINSQIGWVVGADIFKTTDSGENWNIQPSGNHVMLLCIDFVSPNLGWSLEASGGKVLKTVDGGNNWFIVSENYLNTFGYFYDVDFISDVIGFAISDNGIIMKTTDGGANWIQIFNNASLGFRRIKINQDGIGWTVGFNGTIVNTTDNGNSWNIQNSPTSIPLLDISIVNQSLAYIVGVNGTILKSLDGGQVWELQESPTSNALLSICFIDENIGWAVGQNGTIIYTINGGIPVELISFTATTIANELILDWSTATETNNSGFEILRFTQNDDDEWYKIGFVPGHGTTTETQHYSFRDNDVNPGKYQYKLKQINYDGTFEYSQIVEVEIPFVNEFSLSQNYPNPFNPSTVISYQLPIIGFVTLKVYDILGREVATLVNEEKPAGEYEVEFYGSELTSGIYFYQLKAGQYSETRKMVLMK